MSNQELFGQKGAGLVPAFREVSPTLTNKMQGSSGWAPYNEDAHLVPVCGGGPESGQIAGTVSRKWSKGSGGPAGDECYNMVACAVRTAQTSANGHGVSVDCAHTLDQAQGQAVCVTGPITHALKADGFDGSEDGTGRGHPVIAFKANAGCEFPPSWDEGHIAPCLQAENQHAVAFNVFGGNKRKDRPEGGFYVEENPDATKALDATGGLNPTCSQGGTCVAFESGPGWWNESDHCGTLRAEGENRPSRPSNVVRENMQVRRLTPVECERLQGFPDGYTAIPWRKGKLDSFITGRDCPDGPRYKALGNSMAVPCMRWIGWRISLTR